MPKTSVTVMGNDEWMMNYPSSFISKRSRLRPDLFVNLRLVAVATTGPVRPRRLSTPYRRDSIFTTTPYGDLMNVVAATCLSI